MRLNFNAVLESASLKLGSAIDRKIVRMAPTNLIVRVSFIARLKHTEISLEWKIPDKDDDDSCINKHFAGNSRSDLYYWDWDFAWHIYN